MPSRHDNVQQLERAGLSVSGGLFVALTMAVLGSLISVNFIPVGDQANRNLQHAGIKRVTKALNNYKSSMGVYPTKEQGLDVLWDQEAVTNEDRPDWSGPYLSGPVTDRWGSAIVYQWPSELSPSDRESSFDLHSAGPDGQINTSDDITNHDDQTLVGMDVFVESDPLQVSDEDTDAS